MTEQKYTPMRIAGKSSNDGEAFIIENNERTVCWTADSLNTLGVGVIAEKDKDLAEFIVKACNEHKWLVDLIADLWDAAKGDLYDSCGDYYALKAMVETALDNS